MTKLTMGGKTLINALRDEGSTIPELCTVIDHSVVAKAVALAMRKICYDFTTGRSDACRGPVKRSSIIAASNELRARGVSKVTPADIAKALGCDRVTVYQHLVRYPLTQVMADISVNIRSW